MEHNNPLKDLLPPVSRDELLLMGDELTQLRELVSRGESVVMAGAPVIACWGLVLALGSFWNLLEEVASFPSIPVAPFELLAGGVGQFIIVKVLKVGRAVKSWRNESISTAWLVGVITIGVFLVGCAIRHMDNLFVTSAFECLVFAVLTTISATASHQRWLLLPAGGWILAAGLILFAADDIWRPAIFSLACLALMTTPGVFLFLGDLKAKR